MNTTTERICWATLALIYLILWVVPALAIRGWLRIPHAGLGILVLAISPSQVLVFMAVRFRMTWARFSAFLLLHVHRESLWPALRQSRIAGVLGLGTQGSWFWPLLQFGYLDHSGTR